MSRYSILEQIKPNSLVKKKFIDYFHLFYTKMSEQMIFIHVNSLLDHIEHVNFKTFQCLSN